MYKIMFSAGEASGDLHGARLAEALKKLQPDIELIGFGGVQMEAAGVRLCRNFKDYSVMGFWEVLVNLRRMFQLRDALLAFMQAEKPDLLVLIDYPDFNWRLAKKAKAMGIPVFSYIPPSAWAWRKGRAKSCARIADEFVAIFPFETQVYEEAGAKISFLGNPLVDTVRPSMTTLAARECFGVAEGQHAVLLLPGSRQQEIRLLLPVMLQAAALLRKERPDTVFFLPVAAGIDRAELEQMAVRAAVPLHYTTEHTYDLMGLADFAIATSGTVVMEAALMGLPCVVLYRLSPISYFIGNLLVHVENFSLPNILAGRRIQPELLQAEVTPENIAAEACRLYRGEAHAAEVKAGLAAACAKLGEPHAAERIAKRILDAAERSHEAVQPIIGGKS